MDEDKEDKRKKEIEETFQTRYKKIIEKREKNKIKEKPKKVSFCDDFSWEKDKLTE